MLLASDSHALWILKLSEINNFARKLCSLGLFNGHVNPTKGTSAQYAISDDIVSSKALGDY